MNRYKIFLVVILLQLSFQLDSAQPLKIAAILAHPDDESTFAVTLYKLAQELHADVDIILITNGEAGYKYSLLSEPIYKLPLTDEKTGRKYLPFIRKQEALNGGKILGIRNYYFLEEPDTGYTKNPDGVLNGEWDIPSIKMKLEKLIQQNDYDLILVMLPTEDNHGHHKAATILALEVVNELKGHKPIVLGESPSKQEEEPTVYYPLTEYPITKADPKYIAQVDRTRKFGYDNRLDYNIIVNWLIAEHKSQGSLQKSANKWHYENFYFFDLNDEDKKKDVKQLFDMLNQQVPKSQTPSIAK